MKWHNSKPMLNCLTILLNTSCSVLLHKHSKHDSPAKSCLCLFSVMVLMTMLAWLLCSLGAVWSYDFQSQLNESDSTFNF